MDWGICHDFTQGFHIFWIFHDADSNIFNLNLLSKLDVNKADSWSRIRNFYESVYIVSRHWFCYVF
jgi:hypothetical protein